VKYCYEEEELITKIRTVPMLTVSDITYWIRTITIFVIVHLKTTFLRECLYMLMIHLHTPSFKLLINYHLKTGNEIQPANVMQLQFLYSTLYKNNLYVNKRYVFCKLNYHILFMNHTL
jgi:hypothetical protein